jgi:hypothetical protein
MQSAVPGNGQPNAEPAHVPTSHVTHAWRSDGAAPLDPAPPERNYAWSMSASLMTLNTWSMSSCVCATGNTTNSTWLTNPLRIMESGAPNTNLDLLSDALSLWRYEFGMAPWKDTDALLWQQGCTLHADAV